MTTPEDKFPRFTVSLHNAPNDRTVSATLVKGNQTKAWYFENDLGEQWLAKQEGGRLVITGSDIAWEEIRLGTEEIVRELERIRERLAGTAPSGPPIEGSGETRVEGGAPATYHSAGVPFTLAGVILRESEMLWVASVMTAVLDGRGSPGKPLN